MAEEWLIDGYNLLHAIPSGKTSKRKKDRDAWLAGLAGFASFKACPMLVVLDGKGEPSELEIHHTRYLRVVYSQKTSADAFIEKRLYERRHKADLLVVTDDRAIANMARGSGARVLGTAAFLEMMKEAQKESSETLHKGKIRSHGFHRPFGDKLKDV